MRRWYVTVLLLLLIAATGGSIFYGAAICAWLDIPMVNYGVYPGMQINTGICGLALIICSIEYLAEMIAGKCSMEADT